MIHCNDDVAVLSPMIFHMFCLTLSKKHHHKVLTINILEPVSAQF